MIEVNEESVVEYLSNLNMIPQPASVKTTPLGGGISNKVIMVRWEDGCAVVKQPREKLNVSMDWPADLRRIHIEAEALRTYSRLIEKTALDRVNVPTVYYEDAENHVLVMECIPNGNTQMWKTELLSGSVDPFIARRIGELLGTLQAAASEDEEIRQQFAFKRHFDELRIDPYHRTCASRNPDVADLIMEEAERVFNEGRTIVHGDFSPKSIMVNRSGASPHLWLFDMEVAHWGDPSFDTGFMLNHLLIKSIHLGHMREQFIGAALDFWSAYKNKVDWDIERETVRELAVLMLARVDGKSPVEYLKDTHKKEALRRIAKRALMENVDTLKDYIELVREEGEALA